VSADPGLGDAVRRAREEAERRLAADGYVEARTDLAPSPVEPLSRERMLEWALIEPDPDLVYSTRKLGAPVTFVKRMLMRGLRQYHGQLVAQQTRFNIHTVALLSQLEERIEKLEQER